MWYSDIYLGGKLSLKAHTKVCMISAANKITPMLTPRLVEGDVQDDKDNEKVWSKSAQMDLSESKPKHIDVDLKEILQKVDLLGTIDWDTSWTKGCPQHNTWVCLYFFFFIFTEWPRLSSQNINSQAFNKINWSYPIQRMLLTHSLRNVWRGKNTYTRNAWYRCYSSI